MTGTKRPTVQPIGENALVAAAQATGFVITIEEQSVLGCYCESAPDEQLPEKYRLSAAKVAQDVEALLWRSADRQRNVGTAAGGEGSASGAARWPLRASNQTRVVRR